MEEEGQLVWTGPLHLSTVMGMCRACPSLAIVKVMLSIQVSVYPTLELFPTFMGLNKAELPNTRVWLNAICLHLQIPNKLEKGFHTFIWLPTWPGRWHSPVYTLFVCLSISFSGVSVCSICIHAGKSVCTQVRVRG